MSPCYTTVTLPMFFNNVRVSKCPKNERSPSFHRFCLMRNEASSRNDPLVMSQEAQISLQRYKTGERRPELCFSTECLCCPCWWCTISSSGLPLTSCPPRYSLSLMTLLFCLVVVNTQSDGVGDMSV